MDNAQTPFLPHVTVATVVERDGRFLFVEERSEGKLVINQPAGHLDAGETLVEAACRETFEETGWRVDITGLLGMQLYRAPGNGVTYYRTTFIGEARQHDPSADLDAGIVRAIWLSPEQARQHTVVPRSPLVLAAVARYLRGERYPLDLLEADI
ncbi:MAG: NUDIX hydrolase [Pseudomonadales bacterium]|nr:NUDIX hydrolase [Gammaproteobacteria bacterium]NNL56137.1 NUDIX hydrolase [Pseudomonadales bacterium]